jgi:sensor c-di-GMP phosphodiesterase-like protein
MKKLICMMVFIAVLLSGCLAEFWQTHVQKIEETERNSANVLKNIEEIFNEGHLTALSVKEYLGLACSDDILMVLNAQVAIRSRIRSAAFIKDGYVYCSNIYVRAALPVDEKIYKKNPILLLPGNKLTPNTPLFYYTEQFEKGMIRIGINADEFVRVIALIGQDNLLVKVGDNYMTKNGNVVNGEVPLADEKTITSSHYPVTIIYSQKVELTLQEFINEKFIALIFILFVSSVFSFGAFTYLNKYTSHRERLKRAINRKEFYPCYQPIVDSVTRETKGFEVLARWNDPQDGNIPPDVFIPLLEAENLIVPFTSVIMQKVLDDLSRLDKSAMKNKYISINIAAQNCQDEVFIKECENLLEKLSEHAIKLVVEVTEREKIALTPNVLSFFQKLNAREVTIALDDFGTGYSGLNYLGKLKVSYLKIDKSFVSHVTGDEASHSLLNCVIDLAATLKLRTVAEGVENEYQAEFLRRRGINFFQGYLFSRPLTYAELRDKWLSC